MEQKIIIKNNNLLFQFSDHNNNLLVLKLWKITRSVIIFNKVSAIKPYFFLCCIFLFNNFGVSFLVSLTILVWYIHQDNCMLYLLINKTSSVLTEKNIRNQKTFTPLNSVKKVQIRSQNKTLPKVKFLRITKKIHPKYKNKTS